MKKKKNISEPFSRCENEISNTFLRPAGTSSPTINTGRVPRFTFARLTNDARTTYSRLAGATTLNARNLNREETKGSAAAVAAAAAPAYEYYSPVQDVFCARMGRRADRQPGALLFFRRRRRRRHPENRRLSASSTLKTRVPPPPPDLMVRKTK